MTCSHNPGCCTAQQHPNSSWLAATLAASQDADLTVWQQQDRRRTAPGTQPSNQAHSPLGTVKLIQRVAAGALLAEPAHHPAQQHRGGGLVAGADLAAFEVGLELRQVLTAAVHLTGE